MASDRKRRTWTPSIDPSSARKIEDQAFLGGQIGMGLDPVKEEDSGSERGSLKRSSVASTMSAISEQSVVFQDMDSEVLHCLVTMFLEFLGSNDKAKEDAFTKQIILLKNLLGELMGIKENGVLPKPEELR